MKITILQGAFLPVPAIRGGAIEKAWERLGREFVKLGQQVTYISRLCDGLPEEEQIEGVHHIRIRGADAVDNSIKLKLLEFPYVWRARRYLPQADILVTHTFWAPLIYPSNSFGKMYVHVGRYPKGQLKFYGKANRLQAPSSSVAEAVKREVPRAKDRVSVVPYPLPWEMNDQTNLENRPKKMLYLGRLHPEKGVLELVRAWCQLSAGERREWKLRIVGPWKKEQGGGGLEYLNKIRNEIKKGEAKIELIGPIFAEAEIIQEYKSSRIFVYPSLAKKGETFGLSILESMSQGCVPLVSSLPCFQDFVSPDNGFIFDENNEGVKNNLLQCLKTAIQIEAKHQQFSDKAYEKAKEFEPSKVARSFLEDFAKME
tara:strand:- start:1073 stop:2185 length:1113 start_codon:yes stop_codon:yes gene_type:complete